MTVTLNDIMKYFGFTGTGAPAQFRAEWSKLTPTDKAQIKDGLSDGSYNYVKPAPTAL